MFIYKIVNTTTGKLYVGQTKRPLEARLKAHFYEAKAKKYTMYLHHSIRKHGQDSFTIELLEECTADSIYDREKHWIKTLNTLSPNGYNEHEGGRGGCLNPSPELREKLRRAKLGKTPWNKGLTKIDPRVAQNAASISAAKAGTPLSESHKQALRKPKRKRSVCLTEDTPQTSETRSSS